MGQSTTMNERIRLSEEKLRLEREIAANGLRINEIRAREKELDAQEMAARAKELENEAKAQEADAKLKQAEARAQMLEKELEEARQNTAEAIMAEADYVADGQAEDQDEEQGKEPHANEYLIPRYHEGCPQPATNTNNIRKSLEEDVNDLFEDVFDKIPPLGTPNGELVCDFELL